MRRPLAETPKHQAPSTQPIPRRRIGESVLAQIESCVGCIYVWEKANCELDQSAGYEAVKERI